MAAPQHRSQNATLDLPTPVAAPPLGRRDEALGGLADRYALRPPDAIADYLRQHPDLVPSLLEAADVIRRYFGNDAPLALEVYLDPEDEDPLPELFALVGTGLPAREARDRLRDLIDDWWTDAVPDGTRRVLVDFERR